MAIFPNAFRFPLTFTGIPMPALELLMIALNAVLALLIWRSQPLRLTSLRFGAILVAWAALSYATAWWVAPALAGPVWRAFH